MKNLYTSQVHVTSGRDGHARSSDGHLDLSLGWPKELGGDGNAANPEQLFAAGYAACFASSLKAAAGTLETTLELKGVDAKAVMSVSDDGSYLVSQVTLQIHADVADGSGPALLAEAKRICAYSNATRGNTAFDASFISFADL
jgi:lipoyl-dependent peroxiredoxin